MEVKAVIEKKEFKADNGSLVEYYSVVLDVCGEDIRCTVKKEDKALLDYLLRK